MIKSLLTLSLLSIILFSSTTESLFWEEVKDSNDIDMLQLYKDKYPDGTFIIFADKKIEKLSGGKIKPSSDTATFFKYGTYKCENFSLVLNHNKSAYYYNNGKKILGVWSSNGRDANLYFREDYRKVIYNIKQKYGKYSIYKNNRYYCGVKEIIR